MTGHRRNRGDWLALATVLMLAAVAWGQQASETIVDIRVEGNKAVATRRILSLIKSRIGQQYVEEVVKDDEQRLLRSERFDSVVATRSQTDEGVILTFRVVERPVIKKLTIEGNHEFTRAELVGEMGFDVGSPMTQVTANSGKQAIESKYLDEGFHDTQVTYDQLAAREGELIYTIREGSKAYVKKIEIRGNEYFSTFSLKLQMGQSQRWWPFVTGAYNPEQVQRDVMTLRNKYIEEGFLDVEVAALPPEFDEDGRKATLTIVIREGPRFRANRLIFKGNTIFSDDELRSRLQLTRGEFLTGEALRRDVKRLENTYGELGYVDARVTQRKVYLDPRAPQPEWAKDLDDETPALVDLEYTVVENDQFYVGRIDIVGNRVTQSRVIRRELTFFPEKLLNAAQMDESRNRLLESLLFSEVKILPTRTVGNTRDVLVEVAEGDTGRFTFGAGINTNTGLVGTIMLTERNFNILGWPRSWDEVLSKRGFRGAGQIFRISAEPGAELSRFSIEWREPYLFDRPLSLGTKAYLFTRARENYDDTRIGAQVSLGKQFKNRWYAEVAGQLETVDIADIDDDAPPEIFADEGTHTLPSIKGTLVRDLTDSRWLPSRGDRLTLTYEQVMGDYNFGVIYTDYRIYHTLYIDAFDRKHILAGRSSVGYIVGDSPIFERFYGGGLNSVRGFAYRGISPRSSVTDDPIGGEFTVYLGGEYTFPLITDQIRGVVFLDTGTVERDFEVTTYRASAGFGIRWTIPFFGPVPLSMDFGFPLSKDEEDDTQIFNFSVGWTY